MSVRLSVLLVVYDMPREAPRTLASMVPPFQKDVQLTDYEVLVLDNGSSRRVSGAFIRSMPENVRFLDVPQPDGSPGNALNWGVQQTSAPHVMCCIDGARIFSDRLIADTIRVIERFQQSFVYTLGWHLGPDVQMNSVKNGYTQQVEDELLDKADWMNNPDALFGISVLAGSSRQGLAGPINESNAFCLPRSAYEQMGGYDPRFKIPGGSLSNLEMFERCVKRESELNICLLGEGTFHQVHGGSATSHPERIETYFREYERIFGRPYRAPIYETMFYGWARRTALQKMSW